MGGAFGKVGLSSLPSSLLLCVCVCVCLFFQGEDGVAYRVDRVVDSDYARRARTQSVGGAAREVRLISLNSLFYLFLGQFLILFI